MKNDRIGGGLLERLVPLKRCNSLVQQKFLSDQKSWPTFIKTSTIMEFKKNTNKKTDN